MAEAKTRIVVLGGGFGGIYAAHGLERACRRFATVEITLVSRHNYFLFIPMLHEAATGAIEPRHVAQAVRRAFRGRHLRFVKADVQAVNLAERKIETSSGVLGYDYLVLALGSTTNLFGLDGSQPHVFELKDLSDARRLHHHIVEMFEQAELQKDRLLRRDLLTFVVAGAGPTGVELAAEIHDFIHHTVVKDHPDIAFEEVDVYLVELAERILPGLDESLSKAAEKKLKGKKIKLLLKTRISQITSDGVQLDGSREIATRTLVWTAGVKANPVVEKLPVERDRMGRIVVNEYLEVVGWPAVYAIGDNAHCLDEVTQKPFPPTAQVAVRQGIRVAQNIAAAIRQDKGQPFRHISWAGLVSLGRRSALVEFFGFKIYGLLALLIWRVIYLSKLPGGQNKIMVALDWVLGLFFERNTAQTEID